MNAIYCIHSSEKLKTSPYVLRRDSGLRGCLISVEKKGAKMKGCRNPLGDKQRENVGAQLMSTGFVGVRTTLWSRPLPRVAIKRALQTDVNE